jgi:hypothetical protein
MSNSLLFGSAVSTPYRVGGKKRERSSHKEPKREPVGENGKLELQMLKAPYPRYLSAESAKKRSDFSRLQCLLPDNIQTDSG